ncbi:MAG: protein kinase [Alphaproteobacteria bacterium]|nr:protein kinase [Alphaproteobacteria bacterium]
MSAVLGSSRLIRPLAEGSEGRVWLAEHESGGEVAVKIVPAGEGDRLAAEVRAVAALDHPHIVRILDHGRVPDDAPADVGPGARWLAMELCEGTLAQRPPYAWSGLQVLLEQLLDALAHAHARGVVHRDLKPANVLWGGDRPGYRLSDFGMALRLDPAREPVIHGGTLPYMAPEQFLRRSALLGPWTDLYAVGCMAWRLVAGKHAFHGETLYEWARAHHEAPLPRLRPRFDVPEGLEDWLLGLLAKSPRARFQLAADAAWALGRLGGIEGGERPEIPSDVELQPTVRADGPVATFDSAVDSVLRRPARPPVEDWRHRERAPHAGPSSLSLFGLRPVPLVARRAERDLVWRSLLEVHQTGESRVLWLEGAAGCGKSHLARWLARRAAETGTAHTLLATHGPTSGPLDGLPGLVRRGLNLEAVEGEEAEHDVRRLLVVHHPELAGREREVLELASPPPGGVTEAATAMRTALAVELVRSFSRVRTTIVWLDDAMWGKATLALARGLAELPVLLLGTHRTGAPVGEVEGEWRAWLAERRARLVPVGPLQADAGNALVREALKLEAGLAADVLERSRGNPLFAVQLVGALERRGDLCATPGGYALVAGATGIRPADMGALWGIRLATLSPQTAEALEVAACLGDRVVASEWHPALAEAGLPVPALDALFEEGLLQGHADRWHFVHGMLREALLARMLAGGRSWYRACSDALATFLGGGQFRDIAGAPYERLESLYSAWYAVVRPDERATVTLRLALLRQQLGKFRGVVAILEPFITDPSVALASRLEASTLLASALKRGGDPERSRAVLDRGRALAGDRRDLLGRFLVWDIVLRRHHDGPQAALDVAEEALQHEYPLVPELALRHMYALILGAVGRDDEAVLEATQVIERSRAEGLVVEEIEGLGVRGIAFIRAGRYTRGAAEFREQLRLVESVGLQASRALPMLNLSCALQRVGCANEALSLALAAVIELTRTGAPDYVAAALFEIVLGLCERGAAESALAWIERLRPLMPHVRAGQHTEFLRMEMIVAHLRRSPDAPDHARRAREAHEDAPLSIRIEIETEATAVLLASGERRPDLAERMHELASRTRGELRARFLHQAWVADPTLANEEQARRALSAVSATDIHYRTREALAELRLPQPPMPDLSIPAGIDLPPIEAAGAVVDAFLRVIAGE